MVEERDLRWHVPRTEKYSKVFSGERPAEQIAEDVTGYLEAADRIDRIRTTSLLRSSGAIRN